MVSTLFGVTFYAVEQYIILKVQFVGVTDRQL